LDIDEVAMTELSCAYDEGIVEIEVAPPVVEVLRPEGLEVSEAEVIEFVAVESEVEKLVENLGMRSDSSLSTLDHDGRFAEVLDIDPVAMSEISCTGDGEIEEIEVLPGRNGRPVFMGLYPEEDEVTPIETPEIKKVTEPVGQFETHSGSSTHTLEHDGRFAEVLDIDLVAMSEISCAGDGEIEEMDEIEVAPPVIGVLRSEGLAVSKVASTEVAAVEPGKEKVAGTGQTETRSDSSLGTLDHDGRFAEVLDIDQMAMSDLSWAVGGDIDEDDVVESPLGKGPVEGIVHALIEVPDEDEVPITTAAAEPVKIVADEKAEVRSEGSNNTLAQDGHFVSVMDIDPVAVSDLSTGPDKEDWVDGRPPVEEEEEEEERKSVKKEQTTREASKESVVVPDQYIQAEHLDRKAEPVIVAARPSSSESIDDEVVKTQSPESPSAEPADIGARYIQDGEIGRAHV
jgi:hypothetical protein